MRIETSRLILREWGRKDRDDLVEGLNNYQVSKWLAFVPCPYTKKNAEDWLRDCARNMRAGRKRSSFNFAIVLKSEKKAIGGIGLGGVKRDQGISGGGFWLNTKYHGRGYGTEALGACIRFAFTRLKLRRLELGFYRGNHASCKIQKKFGFRIEGLRRKRFRCLADGKVKDEIITGLLKEEWKRRAR